MTIFPEIIDSLTFGKGKCVENASWNWVATFLNSLMNSYPAGLSWAIVRNQLQCEWQDKYDFWQKGLKTAFSPLDSILISKSVGKNQVYCFSLLQVKKVEHVPRFFSFSDGTKETERNIDMYIHQKWLILMEHEPWAHLLFTPKRLIRATQLKYASGNLLPAPYLLPCLDSKDSTLIWQHLNKHGFQDLNKADAERGMVYSIYSKIVGISLEQRAEGRACKRQVVVELQDTLGNFGKLQLVDEEIALTRLFVQGDHLILHNPFLSHDGNCWMGTRTTLLLVGQNDVDPNLPIASQPEQEVDMTMHLKRVTKSSIESGQSNLTLFGRVLKVYGWKDGVRGMRLQLSDDFVDVSLIGSIGETFFLSGHEVLLQGCKVISDKVILKDGQISNISINRGILVSPPLRRLEPLRSLRHGSIHSRVWVTDWRCVGKDMFGLLHHCGRLVQSEVDRDVCTWCNQVLTTTHDSIECFVIELTVEDGIDNINVQLLPQSAEELVKISVSEMKKLSFSAQESQWNRVLGHEVDCCLSWNGKQVSMDQCVPVSVRSSVLESLEK